MPELRLPENFFLLHTREEELRLKSTSIIEKSPQFLLHLHIVESVMNMLDILRQFQKEDEDFKVIQVLGMRLFNDFASVIKLVLSGYYQTGAMVMRDILETLFLLDFFRTNQTAIADWRSIDGRQHWKKFKPKAVRDALDKRDGFSEKKRQKKYSLFSELAAHPSMASIAMLRPKNGMDARIGPFVEASTLEALLSEMGLLAVQAGEVFGAFFPDEWLQGKVTCDKFLMIKQEWINEFYSPVTLDRA